MIETPNSNPTPHPSHALLEICDIALPRLLLGEGRQRVSERTDRPVDVFVAMRQ
jgi:hypothetical protein